MSARCRQCERHDASVTRAEGDLRAVARKLARRESTSLRIQLAKAKAQLELHRKYREDHLKEEH